MGFNVVGLDFQCLAVMLDRLASPSVVANAMPRLLWATIFASAGERVGPERFAVAPIRCLTPGEDG